MVCCAEEVDVVALCVCDARMRVLCGSSFRARVCVP